MQLFTEKNRNKFMIQNTSVNTRTLYQRPDKTYFVRIETYNFKTKTYNPSYDMNFGLFSEALDCVNFKGSK
jgi:hypothetical protein